jgi:hypothetical protein
MLGALIDSIISAIPGKGGAIINLVWLGVCVTAFIILLILLR